MVKIYNKSPKRVTNPEFRCASVKLISMPSFDLEIVINRKTTRVYKVYDDGTKVLLKHPRKTRTLAPKPTKIAA